MGRGGGGGGESEGSDGCFGECGRMHEGKSESVAVGRRSRKAGGESGKQMNV